ncbi:MAG: hypothetical protein AABZ30_00030 [Myxococcota bacterium]
MALHRHSLLALAAIAVAMAHGTAHADADPALAVSLVRERDYFRAISVYKELAFHERDAAQRSRWIYAIGQAYRLSGRCDLAMDVLAPLLHGSEPTPNVTGRAYLQVGLCDLSLGSSAQAVVSLEAARVRGEGARADLFRGIVDFRGERWSAARGRFLAAARDAPDAATARVATDLADRAAHGESIPRRSPWLAGALSAVLPGAGQAYAGHWFDALQAFGFVGAFGIASLVAYRYESTQGEPFVLTGLALGITGVFYGANVLGAARTTRYFNARQRDLHEGDLVRRAVETPF